MSDLRECYAKHITEEQLTKLVLLGFTITDSDTLDHINGNDYLIFYTYDEAMSRFKNAGYNRDSEVILIELTRKIMGSWVKDETVTFDMDEMITEIIKMKELENGD